ncbi:MAG: outer membrane beta-barrel protein [Gemmatimonadota bacterium]
MHAVRSLVLATCTTLALAMPIAAQTGTPDPGKGISLSPYFGVVVPTADLFSYQNGSQTQITKLSIGLVVGGRLGIGFGPRVGFEADVGYSPGSLDLQQSSSGFNQDVTTLTGSGKLTFYLIPRSSPLWIGVSGGVAGVKHTLKAGGAAEQAGLVGGTDVGGVVGARVGVRLGKLIAVTAGADDYLYTAKFDAQNNQTSEKKQHDIHFTFGVRLPFLGF